MRTLSSDRANDDERPAQPKGVDVILCTWNLNNRVGKVPFRLEAAKAAASLKADVLVLTEFYPADREGEFRD